MPTKPPKKPASAAEVNSEGMSLRDIAKELGITRARVQQIEAAALAKLALRARRLNPDDFSRD